MIPGLIFDIWKQDIVEKIILMEMYKKIREENDVLWHKIIEEQLEYRPSSIIHEYEYI